jgi:RimJ/RimL family protein N-acetyltransferase
LQLSAIREDEIELLLPLFNEPDAAGFYVPAMIRPYNLEQLKGLMGDWNDRAESYVFAIRKEGLLVGIANVDGFSWANAHAEIGIALASPSYRGQGIAAAPYSCFCNIFSWR